MSIPSIASTRSPRISPASVAGVLGSFSGKARFRRMYEKRIFPAINVNRSGTRREELLIKQDVLQKIWVLRKLLYPMDELEATEFLLDKIKGTKSNADFFDSMRRV